jgi:hypothetical protein
VSTRLATPAILALRIMRSGVLSVMPKKPV